MNRRPLVGSVLPAAVLLTLVLLTLVLPGAAADAAPAADDTRPARATSRCLKLMDLIACGDALNKRPNSPELLVAEADTLVRLRRPGEAIGVYRNALTVGASHSALDPRVAAARALRRSLLASCLTRQGVAAEQACESAWLPGAPDEVAVFKRRGWLLHHSGASSAALDAYMAAARLAPKDRAVARAIVALAAVTGRKDRPSQDALAAARERLRIAPTLTTPTLTTPTAVAASAPAVSPDTYTNTAEVTRSN